ncbi:unnamed protein product, partial [Medioppia subpectinata]
MLKRTGSDGNGRQSDIAFLNLNYVTDVRIDRYNLMPSFRLSSTVMETRKLMPTDDNKENMFTVGSVVSCLYPSATPAVTDWISGEVMAFDYTRRILMLKRAGSDGNGRHSDIAFLNLNYVTDVRIDLLVSGQVVANNALPLIKIKSLDDRYNLMVRQRKELIAAVGAGITNTGVLMYAFLEKINGNIVHLDKKVIVVDNSVRIAPPYSVNDCVDINCNLPALTEGLKYVRRLVTRFW